MHTYWGLGFQGYVWAMNCTVPSEFQVTQLPALSDLSGKTCPLPQEQPLPSVPPQQAGRSGACRNEDNKFGSEVRIRGNFTWKGWHLSLRRAWLSASPSFQSWWCSGTMSWHHAETQWRSQGLLHKNQTSRTASLEIGEARLCYDCLGSLRALQVTDTFLENCCQPSTPSSSASCQHAVKKQ